MSHEILIVDDEAAQLELLDINLRRAGFETRLARDGWDALSQIADSKPDLIILDWMLPEMSGLDVCRELRADPSNYAIPILMLSARIAEHDRANGLEMGADDYVTKPFSPRELVARVKAILRRSQGRLKQNILQVGALCLNAETHQVLVDNVEIHLGPREFKLLKVLMARPAHVFNRAQLLDMAWENASDIDERTVDVHMSRLRRALHKNAVQKTDYIRTIRGVGYALAAHPQRPPSPPSTPSPPILNAPAHKIKKPDCPQS